MADTSDKGGDGWGKGPSFLQPNQDGNGGASGSFAPETASFAGQPSFGESSFAPSSRSFTGASAPGSDADIAYALHGGGSPSGSFVPGASSFASPQGQDPLGNLAADEASRAGSYTETTFVPESIDKGSDSFGSVPGTGGLPDEASAEGSFTESRSVSYVDKLSEAVTGVVFGLALVVITAGVLFWNEGRAVKTHRSLNEGAGLVHDVGNGRVDPGNEGKLVHLQGDLAATAPLLDPALGMQVRAARLVRTVEMFQWREESRTETHKRVGGGEDRVTTYTYTRVWSDHRNESDRFHNQNGHTNPQMRYSRFDAVAADASLGAFRPGAAVLNRLPADDVQPFRDEDLARLRGRLGLGPSSIVDGRLYLGQDPANPRVGDLRMTYHVAPLGPVSFIGRQTGADIQEFQTSAGDRLLLARPGLVSADAMFARAQSENDVLTWIIRAVGTILMWVGFALILRPLAVIGDVVPVIGSVLGAGTAIAAFLLTLVVAPVVVGIAWLFYRPLIGALILAAGAAAVYGIRHLAHRRAAARSGPPPLMPARV